MSLRMSIARTSGPTGRVLEALLRAEGVTIDQDGQGIVSYGVPLLRTARPTLNSRAGAVDKVGQLVTFVASNIPCPRWLNADELETYYKDGREGELWLARKRYHHGGTDIKPVVQGEEAAWRAEAGFDYFVKHIPIRTEYRVWVYRRNHLATYQKVMAHPDQYRFIGRNHRNGFAFQLVRSEDIPRGAVDLGLRAVEALNLDFGAVDILQSTQGDFYVLEVNTAPGVEGAVRQGLRALASHIARWDRDGHPNRRTERR